MKAILIRLYDQPEGLNQYSLARLMPKTQEWNRFRELLAKLVENGLVIQLSADYVKKGATIWRITDGGRGTLQKLRQLESDSNIRLFLPRSN